MNIRTYARIMDDAVVELFSTNGNIGTMFHADLRWLDVTDVAGIARGWSFDGTRFSRPILVAAEPEAQVLPDPALPQPAPSPPQEAEQPDR
jgi:hypothetical protein